MRRSGVTMLELTIAMIVVAAVLAGIAQLLSLVAKQQRESERRIAALHEAANQLERAAALPWDRLTGDAQAWGLSPEAAATLPAGTLAVRVEPGEPQHDTAPAVRRVVVEVRWRNSAGQEVEPVRLVAWRFAREATP